MNPLSALTYYRRHKRQALLLVSLVTLVTLGLGIIVSVLDSAMDYTYTTKNYLTRFSLVTPAIGQALEPAVVSQIQTHPDVERAFPVTQLYVNAPSLFGDESFYLLGVSEADVQVLMDVCDLRLREGRLLRPRTNEIVLSTEIANALGLRVGDRISHSIDERRYRGIPTELVLVGILESSSLTDSEPGIRAGFASYEYIISHELYISQSSGLIVVAQQGRKAIVDDFLETKVFSTSTEVATYGRLVELFEPARQMLYFVFTVVDCLVAVVVALVVATINRIALTQRLAELGLLHALGHKKNWIGRRLTLETAVVAGIGWLIGLTFSWLILLWVRVNLYEPRGMELNLANFVPIWFTAPIPLVVIGSAALSMVRIFARLDAVAIVEQGKLSMEGAEGKRQKAKRSSGRPLSSLVFYLRHRRRGWLLVVAMALMILGVSFPVFFFAPIIDAQKSFITYLHYVSEVSPKEGRAVDPGVVAQIKTHPAVERVIPSIPFSLGVSVPPLTQTGAPAYGVPDEDLPVLLDLLGLSLKDGRLPRARSNEIVLSETIAVNRGLRVGDRVGRPAHEEDSFPVELEVVGILQSRPGSYLSPDDLWLGLASYEYLESHELTSSRRVDMFLVPAEGRKAEMDSWLEENVASPQTAVQTYDVFHAKFQQTMIGAFFMFAVVESVIAIVAAVALATLNYIFFAQRREEFGTLHAMGYSRRWLVLRTVKESASAAALAWLIGAAACIAGLIYIQVNLYAPKGLSLDFGNLAPWLFTFPIPLAVVVASAGTIAWILSRLDPVAVIERR
jgi:ABC-type lipoprotein release transport system permease subunit